MEFLLSTSLEILNRGSEPTFCTTVGREVIDITLASYGLVDSITDWEISSEPSLSDHRYICSVCVTRLRYSTSGTLGALIGSPFEGA